MNLAVEPQNATDLIDRLKAGDSEAYEKIYSLFSKTLLAAAYKKTGDKIIAEELVQNIFISLWEKRLNADIQNLQAYLFGSLKYAVMNHIRKQVLENKYMAYKNLDYNETHQDTASLVNLNDLSGLIEKGINSLPEKTQEVFRLSRYEHQTTKDISAELNISEKAVEYHITRSLKRIKQYIKNFYLFL
ncbi:RNA polymerase sigma factor [Pedobacter nototheniae]|uniref:RNA polymerase sigma factor n=1 Tax=Pedobacter nototheniae TaxID=2488994 RepID=UPI00292E8070|nr:sigma-70 family RNA polymerase sigma factor [Pedobacter nototheniae]